MVVPRMSGSGSFRVAMPKLTVLRTCAKLFPLKGKSQSICPLYVALIHTDAHTHMHTYKVCTEMYTAALIGRSQKQ